MHCKLSVRGGREPGGKEVEVGRSFFRPVHRVDMISISTD